MHISVAQVGWPSLQFPRCVWDNWQGNLKGKWGTHHVKWKVTAKVSLPFHFQHNSMNDYGIATWIWTCDHKSQMVGVKLLAGASLRRVDVTCLCVSWVELGSDFGHGRYLEERHIDITWYYAMIYSSFKWKFTQYYWWREEGLAARQFRNGWQQIPLATVTARKCNSIPRLENFGWWAAKPPSPLTLVQE